MSAALLPVERELTAEVLRRRVRASLERDPADLVVANCRLANVYSEEIHPADVAIRDGAIVAIREGYGGDAVTRIDCGGRLLIPGLVQPRLDGFFASTGASLGAGTTSCFVDALPTASEAGTRYLATGTREGVIPARTCATADEVRACLREGEMAILAPATRDALATLLGHLVARQIDLRHVCLSAIPGDGVSLLDAVAQAVAAGLSTIRAVQLGTLQPATHEGLDHLIGSVAPGRRADLLVVDDLADAGPALVVVDGAIVVRDSTRIA